jgi:DNA-binding transcriptional regulator/RsmH inhibitor MraZ
MSSITIDFLTKVKESPTPKLLRWSLFATWGASLLLMAVAIAAVQSQREAIKTVGLDSAPSILNAQRMKDSLADMDANAASELLAQPGQNPDAVTGYDKRREKLSKLLVAVSENITFDDQERIPIQTIQSKVGDYIQLIQQARDFNAQGDQANKLKAYRAAADLMDKTLLPAATDLSEVNHTQLNLSYRNQQSIAASSLFVVTIVGFLLLGLLIGVQLFLNQRMRRMLNPGLLAASAIAILFLSYTYQTLNSAAAHLKTAKESAFDSLYALRVARSLAYSANGDESRYLLDRALATTHEQAFFQKSNQIATIPTNQTFDSVANAYQATSDRAFKVPGFQGFLADALHNITFNGEREAAVETLRSFAVYLKIDSQIRQLERSGRDQEAIALCVGNNVGQSNWAFEQYKAAHQKVMNINMAEFQESVLQAFREVGVDTEFKVSVNPNPQDAQTVAANESIQILGTTKKVEPHAVTRFEIIAASAVVAIALCTFLGLSPRIKEYSV